MLRSNFEKGSTRWAVRRAQWISMGIKEEDFDKPKVAVINSSSGLSVCYQHLDDLSDLAQKAVNDAGGLAFEINTIAPSDFITSAGKKARYLMPSRDLIVNDIEAMIEGSVLDGMIMLSSCDKTTPAHLMAAARLNIPAVVVPCGYQLGGNCGDKEIDIEEVYKAVGTVLTEKMKIEELEEWTRCAIKGPGVCAGLATANSMHCMAEALGMAQSGTTPIRAGSERLNTVVKQAGKKIIELINLDKKPRDILTKEAFENAIRVAISIGCSINTVRHLTAISVETGLNIDVIKMFEEESEKLPLIAQVRPNGTTRIEEFDAAGGTLGVLKRLEKVLNLNVKTIDADKLSDILNREININDKFIKTLDNPFRNEPGLTIIRGNIAPNGAIVKLSAVEGAHRIFEGRAKIFEDEDIALQELSKRKIKDGDVVVLRMMGPVGGPGTVFACSFMAALSGAGLSDTVSVVTDGELSGLNKGITIGQVMPEAAMGGPLAVIKENEIIRINLNDKRIDLLIPDEELKERVENLKMPNRDLKHGLLKLYSENVQPLERGAVLGK